MSPEQAQGKKVDARSDIFSFGVVMYEMLTGTKAFPGDSAITTLTAILRDDVKPVAELVPDVPAEVVEIIGLALRKDPKDRWQSMQVMYTVLAAQKAKFDSGVMSNSGFVPPVGRPASQPPWRPPSQAPAPGPPETPRRKRGNKWIWIAIGLSFAYWGTCGRPSRNVRISKRKMDVPGLSIETSPAAPALPDAPDAPVAEKKGSGSSVLTNQSIIAMVGAEVPETVIIGHIRASKTKFDLSTEAIITLSKNDVPPAVIEAMRNPTGKGAAAPAAVTATVVAAKDTRLVPLLGGVPFEITLMEEVPNDPAEGLTLHFQAAKDYRVDGAVAIARGAEVTGEVIGAGKKGILGRGGKPVFRLIAVDAVDGTKLKVKAAPGRSSDKNEHNIEPPGHRGKESLAPAGSTYLAYFDGDQTVAVKK
jgi:serine/threonine-protein kinase